MLTRKKRGGGADAGGLAGRGATFTVKFQVLISAKQQVALRKAAHDTGRSQGLIVREALGLWLWTYASGKLPALRVSDDTGQIEIASPGAT